MINITLQKVTGVPPDFRLDSGPVQFGEDWPGVFLRGDNAAMIGSILAGFVVDGLNIGNTSPRDFALYGLLISHAATLVSCDMSGIMVRRIEDIRAQMERAALLADAPTPGGVQ